MEFTWMVELKNGLVHNENTIPYKDIPRQDVVKIGVGDGINFYNSMQILFNKKFYIRRRVRKRWHRGAKEVTVWMFGVGDRKRWVFPDGRTVTRAIFGPPNSLFGSPKLRSEER